MTDRQNVCDKPIHLGLVVGTEIPHLAGVASFHGEAEWCWRFPPCAYSDEEFRFVDGDVIFFFRVAFFLEHTDVAGLDLCKAQLLPLVTLGVIKQRW